MSRPAPQVETPGYCRHAARRAAWGKLLNTPAINPPPYRLTTKIAKSAFQFGSSVTAHFRSVFSAIC